jgi:hypothetical protein
MNLVRGRQTTHRFPHPRAGGDGREKDLDLFARGRVHRLQVHGDEQRESGYLGGCAASLECAAVAYPKHLPACRFARLRQHRADAQGLPKLAERAQHRGFGELPAQCLAGRPGGECALLVQNLPKLQHQRRDFVSGGFLRRVLPVRIGAQGKNEGQRLTVGQKIRLFADGAQQIERHYGAGGDEARQQSTRLLDGGGIWRSLAGADAGFDERGSWRRQLRLPRQIKTQGMLLEPALGVIEGKDGALFLAPVRRPCCLELLCDQGSLFSRVVVATGLDPCLGCHERFHDDRVRPGFGGLFSAKGLV